MSYFAIITAKALIAEEKRLQRLEKHDMSKRDPSADGRLCQTALEIARQEATPKIRQMAEAFRRVSMAEFSMGDRFELLFLLTMHASVVDG